MHLSGNELWQRKGKVWVGLFRLNGWNAPSEPALDRDVGRRRHEGLSLMGRLPMWTKSGSGASR